MELKDLVAIAGQSGLHKIVGRSKNGLIVETIGTGRRFSTSFQDKVSVLTDIAIYTTGDDMRLADVFLKFKELGEVPTAKQDMKEIRSFLVDAIQLDSERVYDNDIKKLLNWWHQVSDLLDYEKLKEIDEPEATEGDAAKEGSTEASAEENKPKVTTPKRPSAPKNSNPKSAAPKANSKGSGGNTTYRPKAV